MTENLTPFNYQTHPIRTRIDDDGGVWFVARDVCDALGISKYRDALTRLDEDERASIEMDTLGGAQEMSAVNESGLYLLIFRSNKPEAKNFRRWVTYEVLPTIRQTGRYISKGAEKDGFSLTEIAKDFKAATVIARAAGLKGDRFRRGANNLTIKRTGVDVLSLMDIALPEEPSVLLSIRDFLEVECEIDPEATAEASALWKAYMHWSSTLTSQTLFGRKMAELGYSSHKSGPLRGRFIYQGLRLLSQPVTEEYHKEQREQK